MEKFFYQKKEICPVSIVPDIEETYWKLPTVDVMEENVRRVMPYINEVISYCDDYSYLDSKKIDVICDLDPYIDKFLAIGVADVLQRKDSENGKELSELWEISMKESRVLTKTICNTEVSEVDTTKLEAGMVVNGYKELCKLLNEKPLKSGNNAHRAQLKRWARYFQMEKGRGRSLVILDVYDEPLPIEDGRKKGNRNIYLKYIEMILLKYIYYQKGQVCYATRNQLWRILGMINSNYKKIPLQILQTECEYNKVSKWELDNFYLRCNAKLNTILFSALNNLANRSLIDYQIQTMIVIPGMKGTTSKHYVATDDEIQKILKVERSVLDGMNLESKNHAACVMRFNEFYQQVNKSLFEKYGWERKYERIKIIFNEDDIQKAITRQEYELQKLYLNERVVDAIDRNAQTVSDNRMKKALMEYETYLKECPEEPKTIGEVVAFTYPSYYVDIQRKLSKKFLSVKSEREDAEKMKLLDKEMEELFANLGTE